MRTLFEELSEAGSVLRGKEHVFVDLPKNMRDPKDAAKVEEVRRILKMKREEDYAQWLKIVSAWRPSE